MHLHLALAVAAPPDACQERLIGVVTNRAGEAVDEARVEVVSTSSIGDDLVSVRSADAGGAFEFAGLCPGPAHIHARAPGGHADRDLEIPTSFLTLRLDEVREVDETIQVVGKTVDPYEKETRSIASLEGEEIAEVRGLDLSTALLNVNGVRVIGTGNINKPVIRGQTANRVAIITDGVRHIGQQWGFDHGPEIDPFAGAKFKVVRGAAAVTYGGGALGGVILVEPPKPPGAPGIEGEANLMAATNDGALVSALRVAGRLPGDLSGFDFRLRGSFTKIASPRTPDYPIDNAASEIGGFGAAVGYVSGGTRVEATWERYDAILGVFSGIKNSNIDSFRNSIRLSEPVSVETFEYSYDIDRPFQEVLHDTAKVEWKQDFGYALSLTTRYGFQYDRRREFDFRRLPERNSIPHVAFDLYAHELSSRLDVQLEAFEIATGVEARRVNNDYFGSTRLVADAVSTGGGAFGLVRWLGLDFDLEAGARVDYVYMDTDQRQPVNGDTEPRIERTFDFMVVSATGGIVWPFAAGWTLRGQVAAASRAPEVNELTIDGGSTGSARYESGAAVQGIELGPETAYEVSTSLEAELDRFELSASAYANYVDDYIYLSPELDPDGEPAFEFNIAGILPSFVYRPVDAAFLGADIEATVGITSFLE
ncbi:MAG: TonB-dependent receptor, partial [Myxococcota bacterium]